MADLRAAVESIGASNVRTLLNSGNVVFDIARAGRSLDARIHDAVADRTGVSANVITLTAEELAEIVDDNPIAQLATDPARFLVAVLHRDVDRKRVDELLSMEWSPDVVAAHTRRSCLYLWCPDGILESALVKQLARILGDGVTTRNLSTIEKLRALAES